MFVTNFDDGLILYNQPDTDIPYLIIMRIWK